MTPGTNLSPSISADLLVAIERSARLAQSEEDFKMGVEQALEPLRSELGVAPRYETTYPGSISVLGGGSSDAVYGHVILEYKRPGRLATPHGLNEAVEELERYLLAEAGRYGTTWEPALRRMIGIALDGRQIFFLRYRGDRRTARPRDAANQPADVALSARRRCAGGLSAGWTDCRQRRDD